MGKDIRALKKKLEKAVGEAKILMSKYHFSKLETFIIVRNFDTGKKKSQIEKMLKVLPLINGKIVNNYEDALKLFNKVYQKKYQNARRKEREANRKRIEANAKVKEEANKIRQEMEADAMANENASRIAIKKMRNKQHKTVMNELRNKTKKLIKDKEQKQIIKKFRNHIVNFSKELKESDRTKVTMIDIKRPENMSLSEMISSLLQLLDPNESIVICLDDTFYYTLNDKTRTSLYNIIMQDLTFEEIADDKTHGSDGEFMQAFLNVEVITISNVIKAHVNNTLTAGFFKYYHLTDIDLSRYQIFMQNDNKEDYINNCLVHALEMGGLSEAKLNAVKSFVKNRELSRTCFKKICNDLDISINFKSLGKNDYLYNNGTSNEVYNIGEVGNHYFINEKTNYTSYSITNYNEVKDIDNFNHIIKKSDGKYYKYDKSRVIDSFELIKILYLNKDTYLTEMNINNSMVLTSQFYNKVDLNPTNLEYSGCNMRPISSNYIDKEDNEDDDDIINVFFDVETYDDEVEEIIVKHGKEKKVIKYLKAYLICCKTIDRNNKIVSKSFVGNPCAFNFLNYLSKFTQNKVRLIAHNAGFDYSFIIQHLNGVNECYRGNHFINSSGWFKKKKIIIKDSYNLLSVKLMKFNSIFGDEVVKSKGVMPFGAYTKINLAKKRINIDEALEHIYNEDDRQTFINNCKELEFNNINPDGKFDMMKYAQYYCLLDCEILMKGYNIFRKWIISELSMDVNDILTITGLAHNYFIREGCYEDVYEMSGIPQIFISKCKVGGRCMINNNKKNKFVSIEYTDDYDGKKECDVIIDADYTSLYSSAIVRLGYLRGKPKILKTTDYDIIKKYDGYFVEIKINKIGVRRNMPNLSYLDNGGVRRFSDDINDYINSTYHVDYIMLEEIIKYHKIEFEVIRGYYYDEGLNNNSIDTTNKLFNLRKKYKDEGNPIQQVYKDILNCPYGRTLLKATEYDNILINNYKNDAEVYLSKNYNKVHSYIKQVKGSHIWRFKVYKEIDNHFNCPQVGCSILSMSKRIMNEVICLAEDNDIFIYYIDTDSIHIKQKDYLKLESLFYDEYNRTLSGKTLGSMHPDFEIYDEKGTKLKFDVIYAIRSIFLGKKSYCDELVGYNKNDKENKTTYYHTRLKGIPASCIDYTINELNQNLNDNNLSCHINNHFELFELMDSGYGIDYDLLEGGRTVRFKMNRDYSIESKDDFCRYLKF